MADLLPDGFIWTPFCPDLDQAIFEPMYTLPKLWLICFQMASFGHLFRPDLDHAIFDLTRKSVCAISVCAELTFQAVEQAGARRKRIWIDQRRARAHLSTSERHLDRRASSESASERIRKSFGSTSVDRESI